VSEGKGANSCVVGSFYNAGNQIPATRLLFRRASSLVELVRHATEETIFYLSGRRAAAQPRAMHIVAGMYPEAVGQLNLKCSVDVMQTPEELQSW